MIRGSRALVGLAAVLACSVLAVPIAEASFPCRNGLLAYSRIGSEFGPPFQATIWLIDPRSGRERPLTHVDRRCRGEDWEDFDPSFSPSGRFIVYTHTDSCGARIADGVYVIRADGRKRRHIPIDDSAVEYRFPGFSPSGRLLVFEREEEAVFITSLARPARDGELQLAREDYTALFPTWGANGRLALVVGSDNVGGHIATVNADGKRLRLVTRSARDSMPHWSPNADRIVFERRKENPATAPLQYRSDILVAPARAKGPVRPKRLTHTRDVFNPTWSPDGRLIGYVRDRPSESFLAIMRARDGRRQRLLTKNVHPDSRISWQPRPRP
jgi:Tol biopolymer transport system component